MLQGLLQGLLQGTLSGLRKLPLQGDERFSPSRVQGPKSSNRGPLRALEGDAGRALMGSLGLRSKGLRSFRGFTVNPLKLEAG